MGREGGAVVLRRSGHGECVEEEGRRAGGAKDVEDALPARDEGVTIRLEDLEEGVEGHAPNLDVGGRLRPHTRLCLVGKSSENLGLHSLLQLRSSRRDILGCNDEDLVENVGRLQSNSGRGDDIVLNEEEMGRDDIPAHPRFTIDEAMDVEERDDAELGYAERSLAESLRMAKSVERLEKR